MFGLRLTFLVLLSLGSTRDCGPQTNIYDHIIADCGRHPPKTNLKRSKSNQSDTLSRSKSMSRAEARKERRHTMASPVTPSYDPSSYVATERDAKDQPNEKKLNRRFSMPAFAPKKAKRASACPIETPVIEPKRPKRAKRASVRWAEPSDIEPKRVKRASLVAEKSDVERPRPKTFSTTPCLRRLEVLREGEELGCAPVTVERTCSVSTGIPECRKRNSFRASKRLGKLMRRSTWMPEAKRDREPEFHMVVDSDADSDVGVVVCD